MFYFNHGHAGGVRLMAFGSYAEEGNGVAVATHGDVGKKFVQVIAQSEMVEKKMSMWACNRNA